ncbi:MAG: cynt3 [Gammaproteobacteria bacterium]|nr:cynt3 [Gammaproteobacteria bacterium]
MKKLVNGILEFRRNHLIGYREKYAHLKLGQSPDALFIGCSDSRVMPNVFASTNPGDLFVIRNVGNLIPPHCDYARNYSVAAAIEFSLTQLPTRDIIVCGHSECGAMRAALGAEKVEMANLREWLENIYCPSEHEMDASQIVSDPSLSCENRLSQLNVLRQIEHLKTYPIIQETIENRGLQIHGWYFDIATGDVYAFDEEVGCFVLIDEEEGGRILSTLE